MRRTILIGIVLAWILAGSPVAGAQNETFIGHAAANAPAVGVYEIGRDGQFRSTLSVLTPGDTIGALVHDEFNQGFYVVSAQRNVGARLEHIRQGQPRVLVASNPTMEYPFAMLRDGDGAWLVLNNAGSAISVMTLQGNQLVQRCAAANLWGWAAAFHPASGQILVRGTSRGSPQYFGYFLIDPATGLWTSFNTVPILASMSSWGFGAREPLYDAGFDGFWDLNFDLTVSTTSVFRVRQGSGMNTLATLPSLFRPADLVHASSRDVRYPFRALLEMPWQQVFSIYDLDRRGQATFVSTLPGVAPLSSLSTLVRRGSRHLAWTLNPAPHTRQLRLSFPGEIGRPYVVGFTLSGVHPGIPLPDGRTIPVNVDPLTLLSVSGGIPGILTRTVGTLDVSGAATVTIDTTLVSPVLKGMRILGAAVVLDPSAPSGIAHVVGPSRVLPCGRVGGLRSSGLIRSQNPRGP